MSGAYYKTHKRMKLDQACKDDRNREYAATRKALALPEILQEIFQHLDVQDKGRAAQVSWLWRDTIERSQLWKGVTALLYYDGNDPDYYCISHSGSFWSIFPYGWSIPFITNLDVDLTTEKSISLVTQSFRNLRSLKLKNMCNDVALALIVCGLKSLRDLDLSGCMDITDMGLATLCGWNGLARDGDVPTLHSLSLSGIEQLTNESLKFLSVGQPALQTIDLSGCANITDGGLRYLIQLADLCVLNAAFCGSISDNGAVHLAQIVNLKDLNLSGSLITKVGLNLLGSGKLRLTSLSVNYCRMMDGQCGEPLSRLMLTKLELHSSNIKDEVVQCLADGPGSSTINTVILTACIWLTNASGRHLARMRNLQVVHLDHSPIDDTFISHLADVADSRIEVVSLRKNSHITDASLSHLLRLPRLRKVIGCHCDIFAKWKQANQRIIVLHDRFDCIECLGAASRVPP